MGVITVSHAVICFLFHSVSQCSKLPHPNVLTLMGVCIEEEQRKLMLVMVPPPFSLFF
jgi:hypothetical protein